MNGFGLLLAVCGGMAGLALLLSLTRFQRQARVLAQVTLLLVLAAVPVAMVFEVMFTEAPAGAGSKATMLAKSISNAMNYGVLVLPCAALAGLALRRANSAIGRRRDRD